MKGDRKVCDEHKVVMNRLDDVKVIKSDVSEMKQKLFCSDDDNLSLFEQVRNAAKALDRHIDWHKKSIGDWKYVITTLIAVIAIFISLLSNKSDTKRIERIEKIIEKRLIYGKVVQNSLRSGGIK